LTPPRPPNPLAKLHHSFNNATIDGSLNQLDLVPFSEPVEKVLHCFRTKRKIQENQTNYYRNNHLLHLATFANSTLHISTVLLIPVEIYPQNPINTRIFGPPRRAGTSLCSAEKKHRASIKNHTCFFVNQTLFVRPPLSL
jgi:hypothetical protein